MCASRIALGRREEVGRAIAGHEVADGRVWMSLLTVPHGRFSDLEQLRRSMTACFGELKRNRGWRLAERRIGLVGFVRAVEVTHGRNGWHPHLHVLWFVKCHPQERTDFEAWLLRRWSAVVAKAGLGEVDGRAVSVQSARSGQAVAEYLGKWGLDWEVTSGAYKKAKGASRNPWRILADYQATGWYPDGELFKEYASAFKGARQLTWSHGLKALYGVDELRDGDVEAAGQVVALIGEDAVRALTESGRMPVLLGEVERLGFAGLVNWMAAEAMLGQVRPGNSVLQTESDAANSI